MPLEITLLSRHNRHLLAKIAEDVFDAPVDAAHVTSYLADPAQRLFLAIEGDLVVGQLQAVVHRHPDKAPGLYVEELGVSPPHQRRGVATALMHAAVTLSENLGCAEIWLATEPENEAANAFYKAFEMQAEHVVMYSRLRDRG